MALLRAIFFKLPALSEIHFHEEYDYEEYAARIVAELYFFFNVKGTNLK